ncbi:adenine phosphoribosyltransferase [Fimbriiglobus ruber]|uniref:Adenine phosphoribosyltransferase n=1 Tax=Fimbriiglobus ruber TaxID=1908690 RepID=A0A225DU61_9BACT|nr:adenine phosphoribosyltransferase [Fimbriiglobus ruber]OWK45050.1 Adenine phosphoribosyltransferase [Fimbriiglobus ruber]
MDLSRYIRDVSDFPKPGILFKDITPLLADPAAFEAAVIQLADHYAAADVGAIAAAEARGFLFAAPVALRLRKPLVPLRKPGKLPYHTHSLKYDLEYGQTELHMHTDGVAPGTKVLMIDDVLATGGTMAAGCRLVERAGGVVVGCAFLIELGFLNGRAKLAGHDVFSLLMY